MMNDNHYDVAILGQGLRYPITITGALSVLGTLSAICFIIYTILHAESSKLEQIRVWSSMFLGATGEPKETSGTKQIQFWTPSLKTRDTKDVKEWETKVTEDDIFKICDIIHQLDDVNGYRRYEVFGHVKSK